MNRILKIIIGLALIGYGFYSDNYWFYLGVMPLITGIINWCPMNRIMGECKDGCCEVSSKSSCCSSENTNEEKSSCCSESNEKEARFSVTKSNEKVTHNISSNDKMVIKILGTGCAKCVALKKVVDEAVKGLDKECEVIKVEDMEEIMAYKVMSTPGLVINDEVKSVGKLLSIDEVTDLINTKGE